MRHGKRRFDLRGRTRDRHEKLDAAIGAFGSSAEYRRYVAFLGTFRFSMDRIMQDIVWPSDWTWRPTVVIDALARDAADLDILLAPTETVNVTLGDQSALLGALYVLEGSTLGARLPKSWAAALGMTDSFGARHLAVMTRDMTQWQSFLRQLDDAEHFDIDRAAEAANAVFEFALRCFETERIAIS